MTRSISKTFLHPDAQVLNSATWASKTSETTDPGLQSELDLPLQFARQHTANSEFQYSSNFGSVGRYFVHQSLQNQLGVFQEQLEHDDSVFELERTGNISLRRTLLQLSSFLHIMAKSLEVTEVDQSLQGYEDQELLDFGTCHHKYILFQLT